MKRGTPAQAGVAGDIVSEDRLMFPNIVRIRSHPVPAAFALALTLAVAGCGGDEGTTDGPAKVKTGKSTKEKDKSPPTDGTARPKPANQVAFPKDKAVGQVSGRVLFEGKAPMRGVLDISSKAECTKLHGDSKTIPDEAVIVDDNGGTLTVRNVFVYVREGLENYKFDVPSEPVVLDQKGCIYVPHVFGLQLGQTLRVLNSDPFAHNVKFPPTTVHREVSRNQGPGGKDDVTDFNVDRDVLCAARCDVHTWMRAYMGVVEHPAFAVTNEKGEFSLPIKLPAGKYKLEARHENGGRKVVDVEVAADGKVTPEKVDFKFERKEIVR